MAIVMDTELKAEILRTAVKIIESGYIPETDSSRQLSLNPNDIAIVYNELEKWLPV
jgi:hypothetical protein